MDTKKLRQKILDLAIRGKLVPQDPNDEPASVLLEHIRAEKERLIKEGKIKRNKKSATDDEIEAPFEIPESWEWVRLEDFVMAVTDGDHQPPPQSATGVPFLVISDVNTGAIDFSHARFVSEEYYNNLPNIRQATKGDILFTVTGSYGITILVETGHRFCFQRHIGLIKTLSCSEWIKVVLQSAYTHKYCDIVATGTAQKTVSLGHLRDLIIPIPSLSEQQRIVNEIERLLTIIDILENNEGDLLKAIDQAKSKILDLAIHGKLVPQDPNDEPAIDLLKSINPKFEACDNEQGANLLPNSWIYCRIQDVFKIAMGTSPVGESLNRNGDGIEFHQGKLCFTELYLGVSDIYTTQSVKIASPKSVLLCVRAPVGVVNITEREICIGRGLCSLAPLNAIQLMYGFYALQTCQMDFEQKATGSTFKAIGGDVVKNHIIPLPPLNEQKRIVAKIEELFAVLDSIKRSLE